MFLQGDNANEVEYVRRRASKCKKTGSLSLHLRRPTSRLQFCCDLVQCGYLLSVDETNDFLLSCRPSQEESQNTPYLAQGWRSSNSVTKEPTEMTRALTYFLWPLVSVAELSDRFHVLRGYRRSFVRPRVAQEGGKRCDLLVGQAILVALHSHLHGAFFS